MFPHPNEPLKLKPLKPSSSSNKKHPEPRSISKPGLPEFRYSPSKDGSQKNLLILLHGIGDTELPFYQLGQQLSLPSTCILSLRGAFPVPLFPNAYSHLPISPVHFLTPDPPPVPTADQLKALHSVVLPALKGLLEYLVKDCHWRTEEIHLFGYAEGGTIGLELARSLHLQYLERDRDQDQHDQDALGRRLGSVISISGPPYSTPPIKSDPIKIDTPVLYMYRPSSSSSSTSTSTSSPSHPSNLKALRTQYHNPQFYLAPSSPSRSRSSQSNGEGPDLTMPSNPSEWRRLMKFWSEVLGREEVLPHSRAGGGGEVFEVVR